MNTVVENRHRFLYELRPPGAKEGIPLATSDVTALVGMHIDEAFTAACLADHFTATPRELVARIVPEFASAPAVAAIRVDLADADQPDAVFTQKFTSGPWTYKAIAQVAQLREEGSLGADEIPTPALVALPSNDAVLALPPLQAPTFVERELSDCGVRSLGEGSLVPDRPVLINRRLVEEAIGQCEAADVVETGGAIYGQVVRLAEPLAGTRTRIVTLLSGTITDTRHTGEVHRYHFSPQALADAQEMCDLRGLGESVQTVLHTHGWNGKCGNCNQSATCPLAEAAPSLQDYELLTTLFPSKATLMPIVGRKLGAETRRPVLMLYAWRHGEMRPIRWQQFDD
jgi:hypothetical protein